MDGFHIGVHIPGQFFLCNQFAVKQKIGNGRLGLVGNIGNQRFDFIFLELFNNSK